MENFWPRIENKSYANLEKQNKKITKTRIGSELMKNLMNGMNLLVRRNREK